MRLREPAIEESPEFALETIDRLISRILALDKNIACRLKCSEQFDNCDVYVDSNLERELLYNIEHTIHHLALVVQFCREEGIDFPEEMSLAYSTSAYLKNSVR